jgi:hypothetical protein
MRAILGCGLTGLVLAIAVGCSRSAPTAAGSGPPSSAPSPTPAAERKRPTFESELVHTNTLNGGTGSSSHKSTRYDDGRPFTAVENFSTTLAGGPVTLKYEVVFVAHRDGKDVYKWTYTVAKAGGSETRGSEATYDGKRTVLVEDRYGSLVLQPPSK